MTRFINHEISGSRQEEPLMRINPTKARDRDENGDHGYTSRESMGSRVPPDCVRILWTTGTRPPLSRQPRNSFGWRGFAARWMATPAWQRHAEREVHWLGDARRDGNSD